MKFLILALAGCVGLCPVSQADAPDDDEVKIELRGLQDKNTQKHERDSELEQNFRTIQKLEKSEGRPNALMPPAPKPGELMDQYFPPEGNATLTNAEVVILCDQHTNVYHSIFNQDFLNLHLKAEDTVLLEAKPAKIPTDPKKNYEVDAVKVEAEFLGWDDMALHKKALEGVRDLMALSRHIKEAREKNQDIGALVGAWAATDVATKDLAITQRNVTLRETLSFVKEAKSKKIPPGRIFILGGCLHFKEPAMKTFLESNFKYAWYTPKGEAPPGSAAAYYSEGETRADAERVQELLSKIYEEKLRSKPPIVASWNFSPYRSTDLVAIRVPSGTAHVVNARFLDGTVKPGELVRFNGQLGENNLKSMGVNRSDQYKVEEVYPKDRPRAPLLDVINDEGKKIQLSGSWFLGTEGIKYTGEGELELLSTTPDFINRLKVRPGQKYKVTVIPSLPSGR